MIQHHPLRADLLPPLLDALDPLPVTVVTDPDPGRTLRSPWRTYRHALVNAPDADHVLILQDDVQLCAGFPAALEAACASRPGRVLAFFVAGQPVDHAQSVRLACSQGWGWAELDPDRWLAAVATCWPCAHVCPLIEFVDGQGWPEEFFADDEIIGRYIRHAGLRPLASVPSLVEHPDRTPSLVSDRAASGADPDRIAACYIGDCDPRQIDWTLGPC